MKPTDYRASIEFVRPFTLLPPALGMVSGSFVALGNYSGAENIGHTALAITGGALAAALLNAASNSINQIFDIEIDRINKPERPLPTGKISLARAWTITGLCYLLALVLAYMLGRSCFVVVAAAALCTAIYSVPPLRTKRHWLAAALTIAIPRGVLLKVAGWSVLREINLLEPWYIGGIFGLFLLGATTTKDYADIEGDKALHCSTLPIRFGIVASIGLIAPCFVLPFALLPLGVQLGILTGNALVLWLLGISSMAWGGYVVYLLAKDPQSLARTENHPSWTQMYLMMMYAQVVLAVAYLI